MIKALEWLKENNPLYADVEINRNFEFDDDTFNIVDENGKFHKPDKPSKDDHLLTLDLHVHAATDINIKQPAGTGLQQYILKDMIGKILFDNLTFILKEKQ